MATWISRAGFPLVLLSIPHSILSSSFVLLCLILFLYVLFPHLCFIVVSRSNTFHLIMLIRVVITFRSGSWFPGKVDNMVIPLPLSDRFEPSVRTLLTREQVLSAMPRPVYNH